MGGEVVCVVKKDMCGWMRGRLWVREGVYGWRRGML